MEVNAIIDKLDKIESLLSGQKTVLTVDELQRYSGIAKSQIYKLTSEKRIPHSKPTGKVLFFEKEKIDEWLLQNRVMTNAEIDQKATNYVVNNSKSL